MNATELKGLAEGVIQAGGPALPTALLVRECPVYEVDLACLEFADESELPPSDWGALSLAQALGEICPADVDAYLGLGATVSEGLLGRLVKAGLLARAGVGDAAAGGGGTNSLLGFLQRFLGPAWQSGQEERGRGRRDTAAQKLYESMAEAEPLCVLTEAGRESLARGAVVRRRVASGRLLFLAEPLLYLATVDERMNRHSQFRRSRVLDPDQVPEHLRFLEEYLNLPPEERAAVCGIEECLKGHTGRFVGIEPGSQWEVREKIVRRSNRRSDKRSEFIRQTVDLMVAGFPSTDEDGVRWRTYLRYRGDVQDCPGVDPVRLLNPGLRTFATALRTVKLDGPRPAEASLRSDGAFRYECDSEMLIQALGEADHPKDGYLVGTTPNWDVGLRVHSEPASGDAARSAFYEFLGRRQTELRRDFDGACRSVEKTLLDYWERHYDLPSPNTAAATLWVRPEMRAALCARRLEADLVTPYATGGRE